MISCLNSDTYRLIDNGCFRVVGDALLYGFMGGGIDEWLQDGRVEPEDSTLY